MILCADDYGLSADIDDAILELTKGGKLSAVSCMVLLDRCSPKGLAELLDCGHKVDVGLHLCLTDEGLPLSVSGTSAKVTPSFPSYGTLVRKAMMGQVNRGEIVGQIGGQYDLFITKSGRSPDFIDGHLHAHQLPGVRTALLDFILSLPANSRPYIRNTYLPLRAVLKEKLPSLKTAVIGLFGARMRQELRRAGVPTNEGFAGVYNFGNWREYRRFLPGFIDCLRHPNGILVVHPGRNEPWRQNELAALREYPFPAGILNRFQRH